MRLGENEMEMIWTWHSINNIKTLWIDGRWWHAKKSGSVRQKETHGAMGSFFSLGCLCAHQFWTSGSHCPETSNKLKVTNIDYKVSVFCHLNFKKMRYNLQAVIPSNGLWIIHDKYPYYFHVVHVHGRLWSDSSLLCPDSHHKTRRVLSVKFNKL